MEFSARNLRVVDDLHLISFFKAHVPELRSLVCVQSNHDLSTNVLSPSRMCRGLAGSSQTGHAVVLSHDGSGGGAIGTSHTGRRPRQVDCGTVVLIAALATRAGAVRSDAVCSGGVRTVVVGMVSVPARFGICEASQPNYEDLIDTFHASNPYLCSYPWRHSSPWRRRASSWPGWLLRGTELFSYIFSGRRPSPSFLKIFRAAAVGDLVKLLALRRRRLLPHFDPVDFLLIDSRGCDGRKTEQWRRAEEDRQGEESRPNGPNRAKATATAEPSAGSDAVGVGGKRSQRLQNQVSVGREHQDDGGL